MEVCVTTTVERKGTERNSFCSTQAAKESNIFFLETKTKQKTRKKKRENGKKGRSLEEKEEATSFRALPISQLVVDSIYYNRLSAYRCQPSKQGQMPSKPSPHQSINSRLIFFLLFVYASR